MKKLLTSILTISILLGSLPISSLSAFATENPNTETEIADSTSTPDLEYTVTTHTIASDSVLPDNEELFAAYTEQLFYGNSFSFFGSAAGDRLSGIDKTLYDAIVPFIKQIAAGKRSSTTIGIGQTVTLNDGTTYTADASVLFNKDTLNETTLRNLLSALLADFPYELYWYDKTLGCDIQCVSSSTELIHVQISFTVAANYQLNHQYKVNTSNAQTAAKAATNAQSIIDDYASQSDYEKLVGYKNEICSLVSYDTSAAANGNFSENNDPWQLIYVFDNDPTTNVVCEGYSKAFMYLCDLTTFSDEISCYTVSGDIGGAHMWNIVTIGGKNYLADITNSDTNTLGYDGSLFLVGSSGTPDTGYSFDYITFKYDENTKAFWGTDESSILTLSATNYSPDSSINAPTVKASNIASSGKIKLTWNAIEGAKGYEVHFSTDSKNWTLLKTTTGTSLNHTSAAVGTKYYYKVRASYSGSDMTSDFSEVISRTCDLPRPTLSVTNVASTGKIKLTWEKLAATKSYKVYRSTDNKTWNLLKETTGTSLTNTSATAGTKYYYKVMAVHNTSAANSAYSEVVSRTCDLARPVASVTLNSSGNPVVNWNKISGASKYKVYIYNSAGTLLKTSTATGTKLTHSSAEKGKTYGYQVAAIHSNSAANSAKSDKVSIRATKASIVERGSYENLSWIVDSDGTLTISGQGAITVYNSMWSASTKDIKSLIIEEGITSIGFCSFMEYTSLTSITLPNSLISIGSQSFQDTGIKKLVIPDSVTSIDWNAFSFCKNLETIYIGAGVAFLGDTAFGWNKNLTKIEVSTDNEYFCAEKDVLFNKDKTTLIQYSIGKQATSYSIPNMVKSIGHSSFADNDYLLNIHIPKNVSAVNDAAFQSCTNLKSVTFEEGVSTVGRQAFWSCLNLKEVTLPQSLTTLNYGAFWDCRKLENIEIPKNVSYIAQDCFDECISLSTITFKGNAPKFDPEVFANVTATAYYPAGNSTWTKAVRQNYDGNLTWKSYELETIQAPVITVSNIASTGKIKLTWNKVYGAVGYKVYRSTDNKNWKLLKEVSGTSLTNTSAVVGTKYYYKVCTVSSDGSTSKYSNVVSRTCDLARPVITVSLNSSGKPVIQWKKISEASKYKVYIYNSDETLLKTSTVTGTKLTHNTAEKGKTYKYRVEALHSNSAAASAKSNTVSIVSK